VGGEKKIKQAETSRQDRTLSFCTAVLGTWRHQGEWELGLRPGDRNSTREGMCREEEEDAA